MSIDYSNAISCPYTSIVFSTMKKAFNCTPQSYQGLVISHILKMISFDITPQLVLIIQPTGSGQSTVPLTYPVLVLGGITVIFENTLLLALASNQMSKIKSLAASSIKDIKLYQLIHLSILASQIGCLMQFNIIQGQGFAAGKIFFKGFETKFDPYFNEVVKEYVRKEKKVSKQDVAYKYFKTCNLIQNALWLVKHGNLCLFLDRDTPICMFVGLYKTSLQLSNKINNHSLCLI